MAQSILGKGDSSLFKWRVIPFPKWRYIIYKIVKLHWQLLKSSSPEPLGQFQPNLAQHFNILGWRGFKFFSNKGLRALPREDNFELAFRKYIEIFFLNLLQNPLDQFQPNLAKKVSFGEGDSSLLKWSAHVVFNG